MAQVVSFEDYRPVERYDGIAWRDARIEELQTGVWTPIETITLTPPDADPANPQRRNLTTANASDEGVWYRVVFVDAGGATSLTDQVSRGATETLAPTALCTEEDVRIYLGRAPSEIDPEDRSTIIRLVNAASETFTDESQRLWIIAADDNPHTRIFDLCQEDLNRGYVRIEDATEVLTVSSFDRRYPADVELVSSWATFTALPNEPITKLTLPYEVGLTTKTSLSVEANWGWPVVPEKVRQAVIYTTAEWFARDVEKFSATFSVEQGTILLPRVLPSQVLEIAISYKRWRVA